MDATLACALAEQEDIFSLKYSVLLSMKDATIQTRGAAMDANLRPPASGEQTGGARNEIMARRERRTRSRKKSRRSRKLNES